MLENIQNFGVYSIYDEAVEKFGLPFVAENDLVALRHCVSALISYDDVNFTDLLVYEIGQYDVSTGVISGYSKDSFHLAFDGNDILTKVKINREIIKQVEDSAKNEIAELQKLKDSKEVK